MARIKHDDTYILVSNLVRKNLLKVLKEKNIIDDNQKLDICIDYIAKNTVISKSRLNKIIKSDEPFHLNAVEAYLLCVVLNINPNDLLDES